LSSGRDVKVGSTPELRARFLIQDLRDTRPSLTRFEKALAGLKRVKKSKCIIN
jgi:hypothetical protein